MLLEKQEWGRRLYAAALSCHRNEHLAETYEFETPQQVDSFWTKMAEALADLLGRQIEANERRKKKVPAAVRKGLFLVPRQATENNGPEF